jgi:Flp pilus assembly protein TadD
LRRGDAAGGVRSLRRAVELEPDNGVLSLELGVAFLHARDLESARSAFARAVELDPDDLLARYNLAGTHVEMGDVAEARAQLKALLARQPRHAQAAAALAKLPAE